MKNSLRFACVFVLFNVAFAQDISTYLSNADQLIQQKKFAAAHTVLDSAIRTLGFEPLLVNSMVNNVLKNHFMHRDFRIFYLRNETDNGKSSAGDKSSIAAPIAVRHPDWMLKNLLEQNPQSAWSYKLWGDFYRLQLAENPSLKVVAVEKHAELQEKIAANYQRAAQLGYNDPEVNSWLGAYYQARNQVKLARQYYLLNLAGNADDPAAFCNMAEIYLAEKQYSQAYNYAVKTLQSAAELSANRRYKATRLAALSLYHLGEEARFMDYITECIQLSPDIQDAYIDLLAYYEEKNDPANSRRTLRQMLLNNPYEDKGYKSLERFSVKRNEYPFGEKLLEELMLRFEHYDEAMGNIYRFRGNLMFHQGYADEAKKLWDLSRRYFSRCLPEDHPMLKQIGDVSRESSLK